MDFSKDAPPERDRTLPSSALAHLGLPLMFADEGGGLNVVVILTLILSAPSLALIHLLSSEIFDTSRMQWTGIRRQAIMEQGAMFATHYVLTNPYTNAILTAALAVLVVACVLLLVFPAETVVDGEGVRVRLLGTRFDRFPWWQICGVRYTQECRETRKTNIYRTFLEIDTTRGTFQMAMRLKVQDAKTADVQEEIIYYDDLEALRTTIEGALKFLRTGKLDEPEQETTLPGADIGI